MKKLMLIGVIVLVYIYAGPGKETGSTAAPKAPESPCKADWTQCADKTDLMKNYSGMPKAMIACKFAAINLASYGSPEFPWIPFRMILDTDYKTDGIAVLGEPDAKFQNGFGAMVRSRVICQYNLRENKVVDVDIAPR